MHKMNYSNKRPSTTSNLQTNDLLVSKLKTNRSASATASKLISATSHFNIDLNSSNGDHDGDHSNSNGSPSYLEKDAALQRLNEELERKSYEIFKKIEQYSNRCKQSNIISEAGDAPLAPHETLSEDFKEEPLRRPTTKNCNVGIEDNNLSLDLDSYNLLFPVTDDDDDTNTLKAESIRSSSVGSGSSGPSQKSSQSRGKGKKTLASPETKEVDIKARRRLQKATESVVKCLQSKLISHEGRLSDLHIQFRQKIQENTMLEGKIRALEDDRERLLKSMSNLQSATEKSLKSADVAKSSLNLKTQAFASLKKDIETLRREEKQNTAVIQNLQTRLNRCLEENERLKNHNRSLQINMRDRQYEDRAVIDELQQKICQLEQQKTILNATISKQSGLVKTLRNHKVLMANTLNANNIQYSLNAHSENV